MEGDDSSNGSTAAGRRQRHHLARSTHCSPFPRHQPLPHLSLPLLPPPLPYKNTCAVRRAFGYPADPDAGMHGARGLFSAGAAGAGGAPGAQQQHQQQQQQRPPAPPPPARGGQDRLVDYLIASDLVKTPRVEAALR